MPRAPATHKLSAGEDASNSNTAVILQRLGSIEDTLRELGRAVITLGKLEERQIGQQTELGRIAALLDKVTERVTALEKNDRGDEAVTAHKRDRIVYWTGILTLAAGIALVAVEYYNGQQEVIQRLRDRPSVVLEAQPPVVERVPSSLQPHVVTPPDERRPQVTLPIAVGPAVKNPDR